MSARQPRKTRSYSEEDRANALAALAANAGNLRRTSRETGVPFNTLKHWALGDYHPEAREAGAQKVAPLADKLEALAHRLADAMPDKIAKATLAQTAIAAGIAIEKMRLLRELPTAIGRADEDLDARIAESERRYADAFERSAAADAAALAAAGDPGRNGHSEPVHPGANGQG